VLKATWFWSPRVMSTEHALQKCRTHRTLRADNGFWQPQENKSDRKTIIQLRVYENNKSKGIRDAIPLSRLLQTGMPVTVGTQSPIPVCDLPYTRRPLACSVCSLFHLGFCTDRHSGLLSLLVSNACILTRCVQWMFRYGLCITWNYLLYKTYVCIYIYIYIYVISLYIMI
jgi:hypothetical protein